MKRVLVLVLALSILIPSNAYASNGSGSGWDSVLTEAKKAFDIARKYASDGIDFVINFLDKDNKSGVRGDGKISTEDGKESYESLVKAAKDSYKTSIGSAKKEYDKKVKLANSKKPVDTVLLQEARLEYEKEKLIARNARDAALKNARLFLIDVLDKSKDIIDGK